MQQSARAARTEDELAKESTCTEDRTHDQNSKQLPVSCFTDFAVCLSACFCLMMLMWSEFVGYYSALVWDWWSGAAACCHNVLRTMFWHGVLCVTHQSLERQGGGGGVNSVTTKENKEKKVLQPHKLRENTVSLYYRIKFLCIISFGNIPLTSVSLSRPSSLLLLKNAFIFFYLSLISHMDSLPDVSLKCLQTMKMSGAIFIWFFFFFFL